MGRMTNIDELTLAAEFPQATYEDWRKLVDGVLKGAPFEKLVSKTSDGLKIDPIYRRAKGAAPVAGRAAAAPWQIMQRIDHPDAKAANAQALHDLENGATGLTLVFAGANGAHGFGLDPSAEAVAQVLDGIYLDAGIGIELQIGPQSRMAPFTWQNISSAEVSTPRPAISASGWTRSGPARCGAPVPTAGRRSCPRSRAQSKASPRWASRVRSPQPMDG
jgi:hypothetical protein